MKQLSKDIAQLISQSLKNAQAAGDLPVFDIPEIRVGSPKREGQGDYAFPAMGLSKLGKKKPILIAEDIVKHLPENDYLEKVEVASPGFINFFVSDAYVKQQVETILSESENFFTLDIGTGKKAQVEFVSANPTGPIHVGRTRGGVIGDTMARLLEAAGYGVQREYYFNNAGNQMVMLGESLKVRYLQALGDDIELSKNHYQGDYLIDYAKELVEAHGDSWRDKEWREFKEFTEQKMFVWIKDSLKTIDIEHDNFFNEDSLFQNEDVWETLAELKENGYVYEAVHWNGADQEEIAASKATEAAHWFATTKFGDSKDRVMVKADGIPTYTLPDIAYHRNKIQRGFDIMVNVLGADHGQQYQTVAWGMRFAFCIPGTTSFVTKNAPVRFISICFCQ